MAEDTNIIKAKIKEEVDKENLYVNYVAYKVTLPWNAATNLISYLLEALLQYYSKSTFLSSSWQ